MEGKKVYLPQEGQEGSWTIWTVVVDKYTGARNSVSEKKRFGVKADPSTPIKQLIDGINAHPKNPQKDQTPMSLSPFDPSTLGYRTGGSRGRRPATSPAEWVATNPDGKPNCSWKPDVANPDQTITEAGLCDGAELAIIKIFRTVG